MECLTLKKSNCKNCYKCIRHCPVKSIRFSGNQAYIIGNECIMCGQCFVVCPQDAKQIVDETEKVRVLLQSDAPVIVSLAPSFIANYEGVGIESMRKALKKLGFFDAEETAIGATIVKNEYESMINEEDRDIIITSCCHSVNLLIQKYFPAELPYLADVLSPMQAHCRDIKRRYPDAKTVFIGPCVAKKDEAQYYEGIVDAVLTFDELTAWLKAENIELVRLDTHGADLHSYQPTVADMTALADSDLVVYIGGESDKWVADAVKNAGTDVKGVSLLALLGDKVKTEQTVEGMEAEEHTHGSDAEETKEADEHVWLSVKNAAFFTKQLTDLLCEADASEAAASLETTE